MSVQISVPPQYGYVLGLCAIAFPLFNQIHASFVARHRGPAKVFYPNAYATPDQVKASVEAYKFNCAQRAHGQMLERAPQFLVMMLVAGLKYPVATTWMGAAWMAFRGLFVYGYVTSEPGSKGKGRSIGSPYYFAEVGLMALCGMTAYGITTGGV